MTSKAFPNPGSIDNHSENHLVLTLESLVHNTEFFYGMVGGMKWRTTPDISQDSARLNPASLWALPTTVENKANLSHLRPIITLILLEKLIH